MKLGEILNMISLKFPHAYSDADIITMINDAQVRIFRTMYKQITESVYDLLEGDPQYPLDISPDGIVGVVANGTQYPHQNIKYAPQARYYYILDGTIGIYPTPAETITRGMTVFHYKEPQPLGSMNDVPDLDSAWHMLLVYQVCMELAETSQDDKGELMRRRFTEQINDIERQYNRSKPARPHQIKDVYHIW